MGDQEDERQEILEELRIQREELRIQREEIDAIRAQHAIDGDFRKTFMTEGIELMRQFLAWFEQTRGVSGDAKPEPRVVDTEVLHKPGKLAHSEWATYTGFRDYFCALEERCKGPMRLRPEQVTKERLASMAGVHPRTINRRMHDWGLDPTRDWPPCETWPQHPLSKNGQGQLFDIGHKLCAMAAAGFLAVLDLSTDGKVDYLIHVCKLVVQEVHKHL